MKFRAQSLYHEYVQQDVVGIEHEARHSCPEREAARLPNPGQWVSASRCYGGAFRMHAGRFGA